MKTYKLYQFKDKADGKMNVKKTMEDYLKVDCNTRNLYVNRKYIFKTKNI